MYGEGLVVEECREVPELEVHGEHDEAQHSRGGGRASGGRRVAGEEGPTDRGGRWCRCRIQPPPLFGVPDPAAGPEAEGKNHRRGSGRESRCQWRHWPPSLGCRPPDDVVLELDEEPPDGLAHLLEADDSDGLDARGGGRRSGRESNEGRSSGHSELMRWRMDSTSSSMWS
jgi:hypothetical protein